MQKGIKIARTELVQVDNFLDTLKCEATRKAYGIQRDRYLKYGVQPALSNPVAVQNHIMSYLKAMKEEDHLSWSYRNLAMNAIKHYYNALTQGQLILNWNWIAKTIGDNDTDYDIIAYSAEDIRKLLDVADVKYRAIILMLASSGMRREALTQIKLKDMTYIEKHELYKIKIYRNSTSKQTAFISPEASKAVQVYITDEKPTTWLFPARPLIDKKTGQIKLEIKLKGHIDPNSVTVRLADLAELAGLRDKKDNVEHTTAFRNPKAAVHSLKHFTLNALELPEPPITTEMQKILVGSSIGKARAAYKKPSDEKLLKEYLKAIPFLTIDQSLVLKTENTELKEKEAEIDVLKSQMAVLQKQFDDLANMMISSQEKRLGIKELKK